VPYLAAYIRAVPLTNRDLLAWFSEDERRECAYCRERACVGLPDAVATFCLVCGAITVEDVRIDLEGRIPVQSRGSEGVSGGSGGAP